MEYPPFLIDQWFIQSGSRAGAAAEDYGREAPAGESRSRRESLANGGQVTHGKHKVPGADTDHHCKPYHKTIEPNIKVSILA